MESIRNFGDSLKNFWNHRVLQKYGRNSSWEEECQKIGLDPKEARKEERRQIKMLNELRKQKNKNP